MNCTNSYDKKEIIPELVQLAQFSKQHVPQQHPKVRAAEETQTTYLQELSAVCKICISYFQDKKDFIEKRVKRLLKAGVTSALAVMVKADSSILTDQTKELLSRLVSNQSAFTNTIKHTAWLMKSPLINLLPSCFYFSIELSWNKA